jgi:lactate dehydrogenase-like 2-hydroxyacid dehydrogenase
MKPDLLVTMTMPDGHSELLAEDFTVHYFPRVADDDPALDDIVGKIRFVLTNGSIGINAALIGRLDQLEIISAYGVGCEKIDIAAARARGIALSNGAGTNAHSVADLAICLMMCASRRIVAADKAAHTGQWAAFRGSATPTISRRRIGIVGLGMIGSGIARRAEGADMEIAYTGPRPKESPWRYVADVAALAKGSDYLVLSCPGGPETRHMIDAGVLRALGPEGFLINVARGSIIDNDALVVALRDGVIAGAAIDVYEDEPNIPDAFKALDNMTLTPHIGGSAADANQAKYLLYMENMRAHMAGKPLPTPVP